MPDVDLNEMEKDIIKNSPRPPLLRERWKTHGAFKDNARLSQALKKIGHESASWDKMTETQREVFDQSMMKWSRILSGRADFRDHWEDLVGYTQLVLEEMR
jgi:hypothetical protein